MIFIHADRLSYQGPKVAGRLSYQGSFNCVTFKHNTQKIKWRITFKARNISLQVPVEQ